MASGAFRGYDETELVVDRAIHLLGIGVGFGAAVIALVFAARAETTGVAMAVVVYAVGLAMMLGFSAAYHLTPASPLRDVFRRCDHAAIFIMIAGTCSAFTLGRPNDEGSIALTALAWIVALGGVVLKLVIPRRFEQISIAAYIAVGFISLAALYPIFGTLDATAIVLLLTGAVLYLAGTAIHLWSALRFQNAIWHAMILVAASCHYAAILMGQA